MSEARWVRWAYEPQSGQLMTSGCGGNNCLVMGETVVCVTTTATTIMIGATAMSLTRAQGERIEGRGGRG